jgi:hypothetical protein
MTNLKCEYNLPLADRRRNRTLWANTSKYTILQKRLKIEENIFKNVTLSLESKNLPHDSKEYNGLY